MAVLKLYGAGVSLVIIDVRPYLSLQTKATSNDLIKLPLGTNEENLNVALISRVLRVRQKEILENGGFLLVSRWRKMFLFSFVPESGKIISAEEVLPGDTVAFGDGKFKVILFPIQHLGTVSSYHIDRMDFESPRDSE